MKQLLKRATPVAAAMLLLGACSSQPSPEVTNTDKGEAFREFLADNYAADLQRSPVMSSYMGIKTRHGEWDEGTEAFYEEEERREKQRLKALYQFDPETLSEADRLSWRLYEASLKRSIAADKYRHHRWAIHQFSGAHSSMPSFMINIHRVADVADAKAYISRLNGVGKAFDELIEQMRIREKKGFLLARWQYPQMIEASQNVLKGAPYDNSGKASTLLADFSKKVNALDIPETEKTTLVKQAKTALVDVVKPAYLRLIKEMQHQYSLASDDDGIWKLNGGDDFYKERLQWFTTTDMTADEVHQLGLKEVARIHEEMKAIMREVGFKGTLQEFFVFMREDEQFYYPNTEEGRAAYLAEATRVIADMRERLPQLFGILPKADIIVKRVEPFRERAAGKAFYQSPPPDGSRPGIYYANLYDMGDMPKYQLQALAYHEGIPGHHMQLSIATELEDVPEFQKYSSFTAYTEGWGLYSEWVAYDMGLYTDPYANFGRLAMELWRAARLVVDTGIHSKQWTRQQAIDYLVSNTPNPVPDCTKAIERYIAMPGQATAYMIGKIKIMELRQKAEDALGDKFDVREFHDTVLKDGPVPLWILEEKIDAMIAAKKA